MEGSGLKQTHLHNSLQREPDMGLPLHAEPVVEASGGVSIRHHADWSWQAALHSGLLLLLPGRLLQPGLLLLLLPVLKPCMLACLQGAGARRSSGA